MKRVRLIDVAGGNVGLENGGMVGGGGGRVQARARALGAGGVARRGAIGVLEASGDEIGMRLVLEPGKQRLIRIGKC